MTDDLVVYRHDPHQMTVGELRAALEGLPDDASVRTSVITEPWSGHGTGYLATAASTVHRRRDSTVHFELYGTVFPGALRRPRPGSVTVHHGQLDTVEQRELRDELSTSVVAAVLPLVGSGVSGSPSDDRRSWTWQFEAGAEPVATAIATARSVVTETCPTWETTSTLDWPNPPVVADHSTLDVVNSDSFHDDRKLLVERRRIRVLQFGLVGWVLLMAVAGIVLEPGWPWFVLIPVAPLILIPIYRRGINVEGSAD